MHVEVILLIMGLVFVIGGFLTALIAMLAEDKRNEDLATRTDMRKFMNSQKYGSSAPVRLGGLIALIVGVVILIAALIVWLV